MRPVTLKTLQAALARYDFENVGKAANEIVWKPSKRSRRRWLVRATSSVPCEASSQAIPGGGYPQMSENSFLRSK